MPKTPKHPLLIIKCYRLFLQGFTDNDLKNEGIKGAEIQKIHKFHACMQQEKVAYRVAQSIGIEKYIAKKMATLYEYWTLGLPLGGKVQAHPRVAFAFSMLLEGLNTDEMMIRGCTEHEINLSRTYMTHYSKMDALPVSISKMSGILPSAIKSMRKMIREREPEQPLMVVMR
ncbi:MAG: hypothetical protein ACYDEF_09400 [Methanosarcina sp.]